jgi:hypothetical protein
MQHSLKKIYKKFDINNKMLCDSILKEALDHEALYTLADTLKPMSSIQMYRLPLLSTNAIQKDSALKVLQQVQHIANSLSNKHFQFIVNPFERADSIYKNVELYVIRTSTLKKKIEQQKNFYAKLAITENTNPATILNITEYEQKYTRWRSYGYLFGYPNYAVDFFVEAGKSQDSTKQFVKRDFFAIPVYASKTGHFTYATPKGYQTSSIDSAIYSKAIETLEKYKKRREKYTTKSGIKAFKIFQKLN